MDRKITISNFPEISVFNEHPGLDAQVKLIGSDQGVYKYKFTLNANQATVPQPITLRWRLPSLNVKGIWKCGALHDKRQQYDWELDHLQSRISVDAPIISAFGHDDSNIITLACSDAINLIESNILLREEDNHLYCHLTFFSERHPAISNYEADIIVDLSPIAYYSVIQNISKWWETFDHLRPASVPDLAKQPLYSTWYNFHQDLDEAILLKECAIASKIGYKLIILDDGWQTMDTNRGYDYTGDWEPIRFPNLNDFVAKVHQLGMQFGLWFSVPFCGKKSKAYRKFKGKFLTENHRWAPVFDPRYPEVRQHLIDIYKNALVNYKLDAFKLDFIDDFKVYPKTVLTKADGRDYANVNEAVDRLMTDVMKTLKAIKPDIAIEFRQKYIGPAMRKFGNMFRAFDCPNDAVSNRIRITDVKLLCGESAVHSDPQTWHAEEQVEIAALQVLNGMFGVPQMSVHLRNISDDHLQMVQFYTDYWTANQHILLDGTFKAFKPLSNYPILSSSIGDHTIVGVYEDEVVRLPNDKTIDILNGKMSDSIIIRNANDHQDYNLIIWDCKGEQQKQQIITLKEGIQEIIVPPSGMLRLQKL
jgi:alpha-galactosidase